MYQLIFDFDDGLQGEHFPPEARKNISVKHVDGPDKDSLL